MNVGANDIDMVPLPCFCPRGTATSRRRLVRNFIFELVAADLLALGLLDPRPLPLAGR